MLKKIAQSIYRNVMDEAGIPASMVMVLRDNPSILNSNFVDKKTASSLDIPRWDELGSSFRGLDSEKGIILGWADSLGTYQSIDLKVPALANLVNMRRVEDFTCDIADIETLCAAKSTLSDYVSLDDFAEKRCSDLITDLSRDALIEHIKHDQIRIIGPRPTDTLSRYGWDGRINLLNDGGAHHFAAVRYIARKIGIKVPITARMQEYTLNALAVNELTSQFDIFAVGDPADNPNAFLGLQDAFKNLRATFLTGSLPWNPNCHDRNSRAIFLPKNDRKSLRVAELFRKEGVLDLGKMLAEKLEIQREMKGLQLGRDLENPSII